MNAIDAGHSPHADQKAPAPKKAGANKSGPAERPVIRKISPEAPWTWLTLAWQQILRAPAVPLGYGLVFSIISFGLVVLLLFSNALPLILPLVGGFLLLGPMLAVGLYEAARRFGKGEGISFKQALFVKTAAPSQLAFVGVVLLLAYFAWVRIAMLLFAFFSGIGGEMPPLDVFFSNLFFTADGLGLLIIGTLSGGLIAFVIFAMSALSIPLLMDRNLDAITAILASLEAVKTNFAPMLLWAWLILLLIAFGVATAFIGLVLTFPLVGLATWHAYRDLTRS
ncbi:hypothetical protein JCM17846_19950 [Iodidimonas nitroreducens]|uniref:DUF2189 domain-containing protein n=1 Tax=Iodidimonas nitroreducens TaxID=1236968 RepID=A0A5A7N7K9_9PROT|nr:DUF2189 domain-containing protein [Iodidimonas nitroreducens]GAK33200.1 putative integral membrane protein [alpha proteobacterium Q-1]GER04313.1 hypothetical protein JCM17846_19950 [Iodidimonas nitroreducens]